MQKSNDQKPHMETLCPWCGLRLRVGLDKKQRPFWRCWRCEIRSFGTGTTLETFQDKGLIWSGKRPTEALRAWIKRAASVVGLKTERRRD